MPINSDDEKILNYIRYCKYIADAYDDPNKRDYNLLLSVLANNVVLYEDEITAVLLSLDIKSPKRIFDIGSGHSEYVNILHKLYPDAIIYQVDKRPIACSYNFILSDAFDLFDSYEFNSDDLIFMSEFLHCKEKNVDLLKLFLNKPCSILINENLYDFFIDYRLRQTGGKILSLSTIAELLGNHDHSYLVYYTMFSYWMLYIKGK